MSMKAIAFRAPGEEEVLEVVELPIPVTGADDVLVRVLGFAISHADVSARSGTLRGVPTGGVTIVGWNGSGVVESVGSAVTTVKVGDHVYFAGAINRPGCYAEYTVVNEHNLALKPKSIDHVTAASMPLTALTAWQAFEHRLGMRIPATDAERKANASKSILITAGAGGVGSIAIQLAKRVFKIGTVIATASRPESIAWCKDLGADIVVDRSNDWKPQLDEHGIKSVDLFLICSQWEGIEMTILSLASYGASICGIARTQATINLGYLAKSALTIGFLHLLEWGHGALLAHLSALVDDGTIKPWVGKKYDTASLENVREGHRALVTKSAIGKITYSAVFD